MEIALARTVPSRDRTCTQLQAQDYTLMLRWAFSSGIALLESIYLSRLGDNWIPHTQDGINKSHSTARLLSQSPGQAVISDYVDLHWHHTCAAISAVSGSDRVNRSLRRCHRGG